MKAKPPPPELSHECFIATVSVYSLAPNEVGQHTTLIHYSDRHTAPEAMALLDSWIVCHPAPEKRTTQGFAQVGDRFMILDDITGIRYSVADLYAAYYGEKYKTHNSGEILFPRLPKIFPKK